MSKLNELAEKMSAVKHHADLYDRHLQNFISHMQLGLQEQVDQARGRVAAQLADSGSNGGWGRFLTLTIEVAGMPKTSMALNVEQIGAKNYLVMATHEPANRGEYTQGESAIYEILGWSLKRFEDLDQQLLEGNPLGQRMNF